MLFSIKVINNLISMAKYPHCQNGDSLLQSLDRKWRLLMQST